MPEIVYPPAPVYTEPPAPGGLFGAKQKHATAIQRAKAEHDRACRRWEQNAAKVREDHAAEAARRARVEKQRQQSLAAAEAAYQVECRQRAAEAMTRNTELARLINELAFDVESAICEYVGIVLSNSVYPDVFPVSHEYAFDLETRELRLTVTVPAAPSAIPTVKQYRYDRTKDEITSTPLSVKAQRDRYGSAVFQVAIRTLYEIFRADRGGKINTIALTVGADRKSPATGYPENVPFVIAAAEHEAFRKFRLTEEGVVPQQTLEYLGAALSKSPFDFKRADTSRGVRVRGQ